MPLAGRFSGGAKQLVEPFHGARQLVAFFGCAARGAFESAFGDWVLSEVTEQVTEEDNVVLANGGLEFRRRLRLARLCADQAEPDCRTSHRVVNRHEMAADCGLQRIRPDEWRE